MSTPISFARVGSSSWGRYTAVVLLGAPLALAAFVGVIIAVDPYRVLPSRSLIAKPSVPDENQRYFFPMMVRTRSFDSYIFGSSTGMLIDPQVMTSLFGGRFSNMAMGDGNAWEQLELLRLVRRESSSLRMLVFTFDAVWCVPDRRLAPHQVERFPSWMYEPPTWSNIFKLLNRTALTQARIVARPPSKWLRIRNEDGYFPFTLAESKYDPVKARAELYGKSNPSELRRHWQSHAKAEISEEVRASWKFPALDDLERELTSIPALTKVLLVGMPVHIAAQPIPGTVGAAREQACKMKAHEIARRHMSSFIDFRILSSVTENDDNYWDPLHYRVFVARRLEQAIGEAANSNASDPDGFWKVFDAASGQ